MKIIYGFQENPFPVTKIFSLWNCYLSTGYRCNIYHIPLISDALKIKWLYNIKCIIWHIWIFSKLNPRWIQR